jgi:S1-C subfamily serine protease
VTGVDWIALAFVAGTGLLGLKKGLIASALSLTGIIVGAIVGARLAPHLLSGGSASPYTPLAGLAGAAVGAVFLETAGTLAGRTLRGSLPLRPLQTLDSLGGLVLGAAAGLALVWVVGASALLVPGQTALRRSAQQSLVLRHLYEKVPPARFMRLLARVDPFPAIAGPESPVEPPDPALLQTAAVRQASPSVVRVLGTACGLRIAGSGWVAKPSLVVTAAHVVAGQSDTVVEKPASDLRFNAIVVAFDSRNDIAVLRVRGLGLRALPIATPKSGEPVAILGYPENGPLSAVPGRLGATTEVLSEDAYGRGPVPRKITSVRGKVRHGNSGGPTVDRRGAVETTMFAARLGSEGGFGVPSDIVRNILRHVRRNAVSTGTCSA